MEIEFEITGITDVLMHKFIEENLSGLEPQEQAKKVAYITESGKLYAPNTWIKRSLVIAGKQIKTYWSKQSRLGTPVAGGIQVLPVELFFDQNKYEVDSRSVVIPATRGRIVRHRPKISNWKLQGTLMVADSRLCKPEGLKQIKEVLETAGAFVGIGDGRMEGFGRFQVTRFVTKE